MNKWSRCPKCRSALVELIEHWSATIWGNKSEDAKWVEGKCLNCLYRWKFRGIVQVSLEWFKEAEDERK